MLKALFLGAGLGIAIARTASLPPSAIMMQTWQNLI